MSNITIPHEFTSSQFDNGCAEASSLELPPGVAPHAILIEYRGQFYWYDFDGREADHEGATTAWVYRRRADGPHAYLTILND
jgi:hypothetical protein